MEDDTKYTHPSYGMAVFSRCSGNPKLVGSALDTHHHFISLSISRGTIFRGDTGDRYHGGMGGDIIQVYFSSAQFAELISTMNVGAGVPCTIKRLMGQGVEPPPTIDTEAENLRTEFKDRMIEFVQKMMNDADDIQGMLTKKSALTVAEKNKVQGFITRLAQELKDNMPFFLEMYQEATEKVVASAKIEVEAFMTHAITMAGVNALQAPNGPSVSVPPLLSEPDVSK